MNKGPEDDHAAGSVLISQQRSSAPRHAIERYGQAWTDPQHLVTNGPFRLEDWEPGASMMLTLDANYNLPIYGNVQQVQMFFVPDPKAELAMYESDLLDGIELSGFSISELDDIRRRHAEEFVSLDDMAVACLVFRIAATPFDDPRVRRAFAHAVDIEKLASAVLHDYEYPALGGLFPSGFPVVEFLAPGAPETMAFQRRSAFNIPIVEYLVDQWRQVLKVEVNAQLLTFSAFRARLLSSPPDIRLAIWGPDYPDPDSLLRPISYLNLWQDPRYEQLIARAREEMNHEQRMALYHMAHRLLLADAAIMPLVYQVGHYLLKPWFRYGIDGQYWQDFVLLPH